MTPVPHDEDDERALAARVVSALLRENYGGLAGNVTGNVVRTGTRASNGNRLGTETGPSNGTRASHGDGASHGNRADGETVATLRLPGTSRVLPLEPDGFVADFRVAEGTPLTLDEVRDAVAALAGTRDAVGAVAFDAECRRTLAETRLRARCLPPPGGTGTETGSGGPPQADDPPRAGSAPRVGGPPRGDGDSWTGAAGQLRYDALAAARPHPVYPASPCRLGLTDADLLACAPEFSPGFQLRWAAVPKRRVTRSYAADPAWWPVPRQVGLDPGLAETHDLFPVHPLTARALAADPLIAGADAPGALADAGAVLAPRPYLQVRPTLSTRTVAVAGQPDQHLKLPLPASTLGLRNRRSIAPATLADGALVGRTLAAILAVEAAESAEAAEAAEVGYSPLNRLLLADETEYAHAGRADLGYLLRRFPPGLERCQVVPIAALTAPAPGGRLTPVLEKLAQRRAGRSVGAGWSGKHRDVLAFACDYFRLVFAVAVTLLVRHGIALESHQQNAALVVGPGEPLRLLVKDFDGTLLRPDRNPEAVGLTDPRMLTDSDEALADVFVTITVHLCVGAVAFGLARAGAAPLEKLLAAARRALTQALDTEGDAPAAKLLRGRVLEADRLTGKSMITAGTLTAKEHTGAADINKHYAAVGPNYLKENR